MSKKLADSIALTLVKHSETPYSPAVLSYGIEILLNTLIKIFVITFVGWVLDILLELYIMIFFFGSFRIITGGVHAHTFMRCLTISLVSFVILTLSYPYTISFFIENSYIVLCLFFVFGVITTLFYVPGRWGKRTFSKKRIAISKWLSISYLTVVSALSWYITMYLDIGRLQEIVWLAVMGITWQYILVTPLGYQLFNKLETIMSLKGDEKHVENHEG
jgi:accessory gene regulator B